ncbi:extracellular solute-binding protein [Haloplasma contractile]|uniref:Solute binding lipoprotein n=1 Tax=Haloplasma contractile SSD-17B TaxID=1033810 RepID=U2FEK5_9MOLU|nr:extracellular solute-binding protein [Haloplasma contractile]ERJ11380.1 Putative solute binding lipoprotein [Haloplasma contractile SSD-17B]
MKRFKIFLFSVSIVGLSACSLFNEAPVITLNKSFETTYDLGSTEPNWIDAVEVTDKEDGTIALTDDQVNTIDVDMNTAGSFDVIYSVTDSGGATTEKTIRITILDKLIVWSITDELQTQGDIAYWEEKYSQKYNGLEVEFKVIPTEDYVSTILPLLQSGEGAPDVFTGLIDMIKQFIQEGYLADLEQMIKDDVDIDISTVESDFIDYVWESGMDKSGTLRALSFDSTPGAIFFRTDLAEKVWPEWDLVTPSEHAPTNVVTDDDGTYMYIYDFMSYEKFNTIEQLAVTAKEVVDSEQNIKLFPNEDSIRFFDSGREPKRWIVNGSLNPEHMHDVIDYMQVAKQFHSEDLKSTYTANTPDWSHEWFAGMRGPIKPVDSDQEYEIMAYSLPTWGLFHVIEPNAKKNDNNSNVNDGTYGKWRVANGPNAYFWGGTFFGIYNKSEKKDAAYDFVKSITLDTERMYERAQSNGDMYSRISIMERIADQYEGNPLLGGQNHFDYFLTEAQKIDVSHVTEYDRQLDTILRTYVDQYKKDEKTLQEALDDFYSEVKATFGDDFIPNNLPTSPE